MEHLISKSENIIAPRIIACNYDCANTCSGLCFQTCLFACTDGCAYEASKA